MIDRDLLLQRQNRDENGNYMWIDELHVQMIYRFIMAHNFKDIVEIGLWDGHTTVALAAALVDGKDFTATLCDVKIRPLVRLLLQDPRLVVYEGPSVKLFQMGAFFDLAIIDGCHEKHTAIEEIDGLSKCGVTTIIAHDCGPRSQPGPVYMRDYYTRRDLWRVVVDDKVRPGMLTERGLMFATRNPAVELPEVNKEWAEVIQ